MNMKTKLAMKRRMQRLGSFLLTASLLLSVLGACAQTPTEPQAADPWTDTMLQAVSAQEGSGPSLALDEAKSEVVYAKLGNDGRLEAIYVVNRVPAGMTDVVDQGAYSEVTPLSVTGRLEQEGARVMASADPDEPFYYQGTLEGQELPWAISIAYKLDGEVVEGSALAGASGQLEMELRVTPQDTIWSDNLMLQISVTFPGEAVRGLEAEGATLALAGSDQLASYVVLPGSAAVQWTLRAEVEAFSLPSLQIAGAPFSLDIELPDLGDLSNIDELDELKDGTTQLADGSRELADGLQQLIDGKPELEDGFAQLQAAAEQLDTSSTELSEGLAQYITGVAELSEGGGELSEGFASFPEGAEPMADGLDELADGMDAYADGVEEFIGGVNPVLTGIQDTADGAEDLQGGAGEIREAFTQLQTSGPQLTAASETIYDGLVELESQLQQAAGDPELQAVLLQLAQTDLEQAGQELTAGSQAIRDALDQLSGGLSQMTGAATGLYEGLGQMIAQLEQALGLPQEQILQAAGITLGESEDPTNLYRLMGFYQAQQEQLLAGLQALHSVGVAGQPAPAQILHDQLPVLAGGLTELAEQYQLFDDELEGLASMLGQVAGLTDLLGGLGDLPNISEGYLAFDTGLQAFVDGVSQLGYGFNGTDEAPGLYQGIVGLADGLGQLGDGAAQLQTGGEALPAGATALADGGRELADGLQAFTEGLQTYQNGLTDYTEGVSILAANGGELRDGLAAYSDGVGEYAEGMDGFGPGLEEYLGGLEQIGDGADELADGLGTFNDEILGMDDEIDGMIEDFIAEFMADYETEAHLPSFTSPANGVVSQIQFVLMTEPIVEDAPPVLEPEVDVDDRGFWGRFLDLFR